jgi:large subunit ribosomal protein L24
MKLKTGDKILVTAGDDKGRTGKIIKVFPAEEKILVEGVNIQKKHKRSAKEGEKGQIVEKPGFIFASNTQLICSKCQKPVRVNYKKEGKKKIRICKKCGQET